MWPPTPERHNPSTYTFTLMSQCPYHDAFKEDRRQGPVLPAEMDGETIPMLLRHKDVRRAAKDYRTYSSDAPFRVPIPSEEDVRSIRQLPIETDPPEHSEYRAIVEPFFRQPKEAEYAARMERLIARMLDEAAAADSVEVVREFALPLQSRALTLLLKMPESEADEWIGWGTHVFRDGEGSSKGAQLENYIHRQLDRAEASPGEDFFSALTQATFRGRRLTRDECVGFANLTFAGGRDTVISTVGGVIAHLGNQPEVLPWLREDAARVVPAGEEFFRVLSPLTHIGRVCPAATDVHGTPVPAGGRVSLGWAAANYDETVFEAPGEIRLDRKPNPHVAFGSGAHTCLGAHHARLIVRTLLTELATRIARIEVLDARPAAPSDANYRRAVGYDHLQVRFVGV